MAEKAKFPKLSRMQKAIWVIAMACLVAALAIPNVFGSHTQTPAYSEMVTMNGAAYYLTIAQHYTQYALFVAFGALIVVSFAIGFYLRDVSSDGEAS